MIEVEAKIKVDNFLEMRKQIRTFARFLKNEKKKDDYYTNHSLEEYPKKSLRIRKSSGKFIVNFKHGDSYKKGVHAKNEVEFEVSDMVGFKKLLKDFGFKKWITKNKRTELYEIKKNFHIELNFVEKLGWFVEIEYLTNSSKKEMAREEVLEIIKKLGVRKNQVVKEGYTMMLWELKKK